MERLAKLIMALVGTALALLLAVGATNALAQAPTATPDLAPAAPVDEMPPPEGFHGHGFGHERGDGEHDALLAEELGITVERLNEAKAAVRARLLEQAVAEGELTQDEADLMLAHAALKGYIDREALLAEALGVTVAELEAAQEERGGMADLMAAQGLDRAALGEALEAAYEEALAQAVTDGVLTQAQADLLRESSPMMDGPGMGRHHGRGHGFRGPHGGRGEMAPEGATPQRFPQGDFQFQMPSSDL